MHERGLASLHELAHKLTVGLTVGISAVMVGDAYRKLECYYGSSGEAAKG
jgi:hypothetical protein